MYKQIFHSNPKNPHIPKFVLCCFEFEFLNFAGEYFLNTKGETPKPHSRDKPPTTKGSNLVHIV